MATDTSSSSSSSPYDTNSPEVQKFISDISLLLSGSHILKSLDDILAPWLRWETSFRQLCLQVSSIKGTLKLEHPFYGLIDIFDAPEVLRKTPPSAVQNPYRYPVLLPLDRSIPSHSRRKPGDLTTVNDLDDFKANLEVFSKGCFSAFTEWDNVVIAGGAVEACLAASPRWARASPENRQDWFDKVHDNSDIDIFFYGISSNEMEAKIAALVSAVRTATSHDPELQKTVHTYSIILPEPYRKIQFVLRKFATPADVLVDFDVDAPCCLYDGSRVWCSPRAIVAFMRQANIVNYKRHSPIYELRLAKYHLRGYECYYPGFDWNRYHLERAASGGYIGRNPDVVYKCEGVALLVTLGRQLERSERLYEKKKVVMRYCRAAASGDDWYYYGGLGRDTDSD